MSIIIPGTELDKAAASVLEKAGSNIVDGSSNFVSNVFNGLIGDRVREWRNRNLIDGAAKTASIFRQAGVSLEKARALPMLEFYSIFEGMSEQDDEDVSQLWAGLLASRMSPSNEAPFDRMIVQILKILNGVEARILKFLDDSGQIVSEHNKARPQQIYSWQNPDTEKAKFQEAEWRQWQSLRADAVKACYEGIFHEDTNEAIHIASIGLIQKNLIFSTSVLVDERELIRRDSIDSDFGRIKFQIVDSSKLADTLNDIKSKSSELPARVAKAGVVSFEHGDFRIFFEPTDLGSSLLRACRL